MCTLWSCLELQVNEEGIEYSALPELGRKQFQHLSFLQVFGRSNRYEGHKLACSQKCTASYIDPLRMQKVYENQD